MDNQTKQYLSGQKDKILQVVILSLISLCFSQSQSCTIIEGKILLDSLVFVAYSSPLERFCLFVPGDTIPSDWTVLEQWADVLSRNPDLCLSLRGTASRMIDNVSEKRAWELADKRCEVVAKKILSLADIDDSRVAFEIPNVESKFPREEEPFGSEEDLRFPYSVRVELTPYFSGFSKRRFIPLERKPFWRESYRTILDEVDTVLVRVLSRNPDAIVIIQGFGFGGDGYEWLKYLRRKLISKIGEDNGHRVYVWNWAMDTAGEPFALLDVVPLSVVPSGKWQEILSSGKDAGFVKLVCLQKPNCLFVAMPGDIIIPAAYDGIGDTVAISFGSFPILPGKYLVYPDAARRSSFRVRIKKFFDITLELELARKYSPEQDFLIYDGIPMSFVSGLLVESMRLNARAELTFIVNAPDTSSGLLWYELFRSEVFSSIQNITGRSAEYFISSGKLDVNTEMGVKSDSPFRVVALINLVSE